MKRVNYSACPLCKSSNLKEYCRVTDHLVSHETFTILQCTTCEFQLTANLPTEEEIGSYYQSEAYVSHSDTSKGLFFSLYHLARRYMLARKCKLITSLFDRTPPNASLLDYGCGTGYFANAMQNCNWQVTGVEKSPDARQFAQSKFGIQPLEPEQLHQVATASQDVVTLWHVLEHIHNLHEVTNELLRTLKPNGYLIIAIPNVASHDAQLYKQNWAAYDVPRHLWHFTPESFQQFAETKKLRIVQTKIMPLDGFYISIMSEQQLNHSFPLVRGFFHGKIGWIKTLFNKKHASSLIYILERK